MSGFNLIDVIALLERAKDTGVKISFVNGKLMIKTDEQKEVDPSFLNELKNNKAHLITYFNKLMHRNDTPSAGRKINIADGANRPENIPLSYSQERLWFIDQLEGSVQYHIPAALRLTGKLNRDVLAKAFRNIVNRHEILRTVITEENGIPYQKVQDKDQWELSITAADAYYEDDAALNTCMKTLVDTPFDLSQDHMLRAHLIVLREDEHILLVVMHHIAADAWSTGIIIRELMASYNDYPAGLEPQLPALPVQYADYALWQKSYLSTGVLEKKLHYWKEKLSGITPIDLPVDYLRSAMHSTSGRTISLHLDDELSGQLNALSQLQGTTLFMTLLAAFKVLMHRYSNQDDICIGCSAAVRPQTEVKDLIGFFVNTLAIRSDLSNDPSFVSLLQQVKQTTLEAYDHQDIPFEKVVEAVAKERYMGRNPLFQVMFVLENVPDEPEFQLGDVRWSALEIARTTARFEITFSIEEKAHGLDIRITYRDNLFREDTIARMAGHFKQLLQAVVLDPAQHISTLQLLTPDEEHQLRYAFGGRKEEQADNGAENFITLFDKQAALTPSHIAVAYEQTALTYEELKARADCLAWYIRSRGIQTGTLVPLYITPSVEMLVALLGILKAGAAYVPIDPDLPVERIDYILKDTGATLIIGCSHTNQQLTVSGDREILVIDRDWEMIRRFSPASGFELPAPGDLAYVIYTSGSTGVPKGVMISHANLVDYTYGLAKVVPVSACRSFGLLSGIATDLGNTVIYSSLAWGGTLHLFAKNTLRDAEQLLHYFSEHEIDCIKIVPSHWKALAFNNHLLLPEKLLVFGGEVLEQEVLDMIRNAGGRCTVVNHYGPTETTVGKLLHVVNNEHRYDTVVPIGRPFGNSFIYILNKSLGLSPVGVPGELYIGGAGVGKGYLNNKALTLKQFITDPCDITSPAMFYKTGDLVKYLPDGNVLFLGRMDDQVKIQGYRVEPGEITRVLNECELVKHGIVIAETETGGINRLAGYIIAAGDFDREAIYAYLRLRLPDYMVPSILQEIVSMPLLPNGKIDRKALMATGKLTSGSTYAPPVTPMEKQLSAIWSSILETEQIGLYDDFFSSGGHSLLAIRVISAMRKEMGLEVSIMDIFDHPTIASLCEVLKYRPVSVHAVPLLPAERPAHIPLSYSQERLWFIDQLEGSAHYHIPHVLGLKGHLNKAALFYALNSIVNRHEALRTVVYQDGGNAYQYILEKDKWQPEEIAGGSYKEDKAALYGLINELVSRPFDLSVDHPLRVYLIKLDTDNHVLVSILHHIASDGWSTGILVRELELLYNAYEHKESATLPALPLQYADYALWQRKHISGTVLNNHLSFWKQQLSGLPMIELPLDDARPAIQSRRGGAGKVLIDGELCTALRNLSRREGVTLYMTLLSTLNVLLYRYSGQEDICIGSPVAGRNHADIEGLIGFFVNTLAIRSNLHNALAFTSFLSQVKQTTLSAYEHQEAPFEKVVEEVVRDRDLSRHPIFQVMFSLQQASEATTLHLGDVAVTGIDIITITSQFDLNLTLEEREDGISGSLVYCADLFSEATIDRMIAHFVQLLKSIVSSPETPVGRLKMLSTAEEYELTAAFNSTTADYVADTGKTILDLFSAQVAKTPFAVAITFGDQQLSYQELDERANRLAHCLQQKGVQPESLVPVCIERSLEMIIAMLGILKASAAYVPIDPDYPEERISYILQDTDAAVIVSSSICVNRLPASLKAIVVIISADTDDSFNDYPKTAPATTPHAGNLAYVIYTSGSTGKPKGTLIEHSSVVRLFETTAAIYDFNNKDVWTMFHSCCFDFSVWEMYGALFYGGRLVIVPAAVARDTLLFGELLITEGVTVLNQTPSAFYVLQDYFIRNKKETGIRYVIFGGEALNPVRIKPWLESYGYCRLINMYGITETTVHVTYQPMDLAGVNGRSIIGRGIPGLSLFILDQYRQLLPVGAAGELYVGGAGLARGYLNRPELTATKFITHAFTHEANVRLYKTGDLCRWLPDGTIEYLGRIDNQVKIRGYRIELGEIENALQESEWVKDAVVLHRPGNKTEAENNNQRLIAYIVPSGIFNDDQIRIYLRNKLPEYMIPALFIEMDQLPLTANGKINKQALPDPVSHQGPAGEYVAPRNSLEQTMADIWKRILNIQQVGIYDNFFDLGGHSLLVMRLTTEIWEAFHEKIPVKLFFQLATIEALALHISVVKKMPLTENKHVRVIKL
ncbi:amino acid adenylation domain-containing protein [Chitinophaga niastensis]|uniref:Amino acid adenylation domain-containing protein n=1 Tax=Chitinophaga niastensis TaxID=536980 RepID=A0A2P8HFM2_CHINA|nr:non-ribosomal peptide synthetase [Chitinophaga niastensis]PSL44993.1 amino acid adenylation domain-containing protein [Chitinophaga niastensis]